MSVSSSTLGNTRQKYKLVFLGDQSVGKSSIIQRYITNSFEQSLNPTVGIDFYLKNVNRNNRQYRLQLWDTAGQERFRSLIPSYMKDADCAIMVYDVTSSKSLEHISIWNNMFEEYKQISSLKVMIGNKIDLSEREVSKADGQKEALKYNAKYFQVSARTGKRLQEVFMSIVDLIAARTQQRIKLDYIKEENVDEDNKERRSQNKIQDKKQEKFQLKKDPLSGEKLKPIKRNSKCCSN